MYCDWCKKKADKLNKLEVYESEIGLCNSCLKAHEEGLCVTCKEPLYSDLPLNGECMSCQQIRSTKAELQREEVLNGLGNEVVNHTRDVGLSEEDYEKWMTTSFRPVSPEVTKKFRRDFIKDKILRDLELDSKEYEDCIEAIEYLIENYTDKIFKVTTRFMFNTEDTQGLRGVNIIARKGRIIAIHKEL